MDTPITLNRDDALDLFDALATALEFCDAMFTAHGQLGPVDELGRSYTLLFDHLWGQLPPGDNS